MLTPSGCRAAPSGEVEATEGVEAARGCAGAPGEGTATHGSASAPGGEPVGDRRGAGPIGAGTTLVGSNKNSNSSEVGGEWLLGKGKRSLVEDHMLRDDDSVGGEIKTAVTFMMSRIAKEDAQSGTRSKFVGCSSGKIRITSATENTKVIIGRLGAKQSHVWRPSVLEGKMLSRCVAVCSDSTQ